MELTTLPPYWHGLKSAATLDLTSGMRLCRRLVFVRLAVHGVEQSHGSAIEQCKAGGCTACGLCCWQHSLCPRRRRHVLQLWLHVQRGERACLLRYMCTTRPGYSVPGEGAPQFNYGWVQDTALPACSMMQKPMKHR